jgi:hypothetical protein
LSNMAPSQRHKEKNSGERSQVRSVERGLIIALIVLTVALSRSSFVSAQPQIPFDGLQLVYFSETTSTVQEKIGVQASWWTTLVFHNVSANSSKLEIDVNGTITQNNQQQAEKFNTTVDFPTDRDTLVFLRNGGQNNLTIYAGPSGLTIPALPGLTLDLTRSWDLHDKPLVRTTLGAFSAYRYHTAFNSIQLPIGGTVNLDVYASYEQNTEVLIAGEVWATISGASVMVEQTEIRATNLLSAVGQSHCLIATATYGSELAPQVEFLRQFRDQQIDNTFAGSNFMLAFNLWYYSFSPSAASAIHASSELQGAMQILLFPMILILQGSAALFGTLSFQPEFAALLAGLAASAMIGVLYLWSPSILICRRYGKRVKNALKPLAAMLGMSVLGLIISEVIGSSVLAASSSATLILSNMFLFAALPSIFSGRKTMLRRLPTKFYYYLKR